jgi:hypothetical protein
MKMRERARAITWADVPFMAASLISGAVLLYLGRSLTFWFDEWRSITFDGDALDYLRPVNEHWSTIPLALYRVTFAVVELQSYLPYLAQVIVLHLVSCAAAYVLMRRRVGRAMATILALPLLLLGTGAENLYWAFQTGFVGSVAFGLWALVMVAMPRRRSAVVSAVLLVASLMSSGIGLFFLVALFARTAVDRGLRGRSLVAAPGALIFLTWYAVFGRSGVGNEGDLGGIGSVLRFTYRGVGHAIEETVGLDPLPTGRAVGIAIVAVLAGVAVRRTLRGRPQGLAIGSLAGLVSMYALVGVARAELQPDYTTRGRYVYVAAFFLVLCIADLMAGADFRVLHSHSRRVAAIAAGTLFTWALLVNVISLETARTQFQHQADVTRAVIHLAIEHEGEPWLDPGAHLDLMPTARELPGFVRNHGSPLEDAYVPSVVPTPSDRAYAEARRYLSVDSG